jgi:hypothetical protein
MPRSTSETFFHFSLVFSFFTSEIDLYHSDLFANFYSYLINIVVLGSCEHKHYQDVPVSDV